MTTILGINAFHADSSAALIKDGVVIVAAEEERFRRIKHWSGFPELSIKSCLSEAKLSINDIEHIAINTNPKANYYRKLIYILRNRPSTRFLFDRWLNKRERLNIKDYLKTLFPNSKINADIHYIEHHITHLASAFYASPFSESALISVDGFGDFASTAIGFGNEKILKKKEQIFFPHSLGVFYTAMTQFLGFPNYGDEYKVMGLAPYGNNIYMDQMKKIVNLNEDGTLELNLSYFNHSKQKIPYQWKSGAPVLGKYFSEKLEQLLGPPKAKDAPLNQNHMDIARSTQEMYEISFFHLLKKLYKIYPSDNICIAGGCGANSVANGKIICKTPFKKVFVQAAAGDAGTALGAAYYVSAKITKERPSKMGPAYLGPKYSKDSIKKLLSDKQIKEKLSTANCKVYIPESESKLLDIVSEAIKNGLVIGWFEGEMEWGPRALGHRSILADPRRSDMKNILNSKIKRRESFRPFAPSILKENVKDWFELGNSHDFEVPYMMKVYPIIKEKRSLIPAVCHVDGTGRLQTVTEIDNGRYYRLIKKFYSLTNVPMILNTSFNENEPIVSSPNEALACFLRTKMDLLVLEDTLLEREQSRK